MDRRARVFELDDMGPCATRELVSIEHKKTARRRLDAGIVLLRRDERQPAPDGKLQHRNRRRET